MDGNFPAFPFARANKVYYNASPVFLSQNQPPSTVLPNSFGFSGNNLLFNQYMNNDNDNFTAFSSHQGNYPSGVPQWQQQFAVPNNPSHPQYNAQQGANVFNAFSIDNLQTRVVPPVVADSVVPPVVKDSTVVDAEQPSTSSASFPPRTRDSVPIYQARVC